MYTVYTNTTTNMPKRSHIKCFEFDVIKPMHASPQTHHTGSYFARYIRRAGAMQGPNYYRMLFFFFWEYICPIVEYALLVV